MIEDVYEPLSRYRDEFRAKFAQLAEAKFRELLAKSGVDVAQNVSLVKAIRRLEKSADSVRSRRAWITFALVVAILVTVGLGFWAYMLHGDGDAVGGVKALGGAMALAALTIFLFRSRCGLSRDLERLEAQVTVKKSEAYRQMAPLNALYDWDIPPRLIEATVPRLAFDPFFTEGRFDELCSRFGWSDENDDKTSMLFAQSGTINGNPFVFGEYLRQDWGEKTYHGQLVIHWTEWERDAKGNSRLVNRSETLHASVTKPLPVYGKDKFLLYGNDAAPDLTFMRRPSKLSGMGDGLFARMRKRSAARKLERFSHNLDDESQYTMMGNKEFETLFNTRDRNHEVQFRLLFTPLAQTQMLALLKDRAVGYGDDFSFRKSHRMNVIRAAHLSSFPIDTDPHRFYDYDVRNAEKTFREFNEEYFRSVYFALAPLLAVPLYQQTRTPEDIWKGVAITPSSYWEHEAMVNWCGARHFKPADCLTECILKTASAGTNGKARVVDVTAHGFRGEQRVDHVSVHGGDGHRHEVPVEWTEYLPTQHTTRVEMEDRRGVSLQDFAASGATADRYRRAMVLRVR